MFEVRVVRIVANCDVDDAVIAKVTIVAEEAYVGARVGCPVGAAVGKTVGKGVGLPGR